MYLVPAPPIFHAADMLWVLALVVMVFIAAEIY
jgi:hypothetical protein